MERLTKRFTKNTVAYVGPGRKYDEELAAELDVRQVREVLSRLADYEDTEEEGRLLVLPCKPEKLDLRRVTELLDKDSQGLVVVRDEVAGPPGEPGAALAFTNADALLHLIREHLAEIVDAENICLSGVAIATCRAETECRKPAGECLKCSGEWLDKPYAKTLRWAENPRRIEATAAGKGEDPWTLLRI